MKSILITGGTGTFGKACVAFLLNSPTTQTLERICIYSRNEHTQAAMRAEFNDDPRLRWLIGDVRDLPRLRRAMVGVEAVIHAAALKRIEVGQYNPDEMVKTNVLGTSNVIEAATSARVHSCVLLSSDKAYAPRSPYGCTKMLAENLFLAANTVYASQGTSFAAARYGNIFGAQGSVVPVWSKLAKAQEAKATLPVTDPECTRFFMTVEDAVVLVWNLLQDMIGGELLIPTWLAAYRLGDLVEAFNCKEHAIGLPAWEKRHESMCDGHSSEHARRMSVVELRQYLAEGDWI